MVSPPKFQFQHLKLHLKIQFQHLKKSQNWGKSHKMEKKNHTMEKNDKMGKKLLPIL